MGSPPQLDPILEEAMQLSHTTSAASIAAYDSSLRALTIENGYLCEESEQLRLELARLSQVREEDCISAIRELEAKDHTISALSSDLLDAQGYLTSLKREHSELRRSQADQSAQELIHLEKHFEAKATEQALTQYAHANDINRLLAELESLKLILTEKDKELSYLTEITRNSAAQYTQNIESLIIENNLLRSRLAQAELRTERETHLTQSRKELQRSRTQGIVDSYHANTTFIEKEINRLTAELQQRNNSIQNLHRNLLKQQRQLELTEFEHSHKINSLQLLHQETVKNLSNAMETASKNAQKQQAELKRAETTLAQELSTLRNVSENQKREIEHLKQEISARDLTIAHLKQGVSENRMNEPESQAKEGDRKSSDQPSAQGEGSNSRLSQGRAHNRSWLVESDLNSDQTARLVSAEREARSQLTQHYEDLIREVKATHASQLRVCQAQASSLQERLTAKQQEFLDMLSRFSPLLEYRVNPGPLDEERRRRIEQFERADIDILDVMLEKYGVVATRSR